ncbi:MAG TPA: hypothetical protein VLR26_09745 [Frankiaceae bacterium]|nr:hypothetical protein [Frankiaceae bacterium]
MIASSPVHQVALPPRQTSHPQVWTDGRVAAWQADGTRPAVAVWTTGQTARFLGAARTDPPYRCCISSPSRGLRRGEAFGLTWDAVDLDRSTLTIDKQVVEVGGQLVTGPPRSAASRRAVALDADSVAVLRAYRTNQALRPGGYVVPAGPGGRSDRNGSPPPSAGSPPRPGCRRSGCTTCGTAPPHSTSPPGRT